MEGGIRLSGHPDLRAGFVPRYGPAVGLLDQLKRRRQKLQAELAEVERAIAAVEATGLQGEHNSGNTDNMRARSMSGQKRMLRAQRAEGTPETARLRAAFKAAKDSMHMAAEKIQSDVRDAGHGYVISQPYLTMAAKGERPMWRPIAEAIEKRYGYAATRENWPDLRDES